MTTGMAAEVPAPVLTAMDLHRAGKLAEAEQAYRALLPQYPDSPDLQYGLGFLALQQGKADAAIQHLEQARGLRPGHGKTLNALGSAYLATGKPVEAQARFAEGYAADPSPMLTENWAVAASYTKSNATVLEIFDTDCIDAENHHS